MLGCITLGPAAKGSMRKTVSRLDIYIFRQVLFALVMATGGLTALIWLTQSLRFVDLVVNRGLSFFVFIHLTALLIPSFVAVILPITTYVVIQFVYQRMATDRELTVMRAAGLSPWALARPALAVALLATVAGYGLSIWGVPAATTNFKEFQWEIRNRLAAFLLQDGVFTPLSDKADGLCPLPRPGWHPCAASWWTMRAIRPPTPPSWRNGAVCWTVPTDRACCCWTAAGRRSTTRPGGSTCSRFKQNEIDLADATKDDVARPIDMSEFPLSALLDPHPSFERDRAKWIAEGHRRLTEPLTTLSYAMVGLFSALGGSFGATAASCAPLVTVGVMVGLLALGLAFGTLAARDKQPAVPDVAARRSLPGVVCCWLLFAPSFRPSPTLRPAEA